MNAPATARADRVVVVNDDARIRDLLRRYLSQEGFEVLLAEDAKALNRVLTRYNGFVDSSATEGGAPPSTGDRDGTFAAALRAHTLPPLRHGPVRHLRGVNTPGQGDAGPPPGGPASSRSGSRPSIRSRTDEGASLTTTRTRPQSRPRSRRAVPPAAQPRSLSAVRT